MGKKNKKTKWRTLEIPSGKRYHESTNTRWDNECRRTASNYHCDRIIKPDTSALKFSSTNEQTKTLQEDEYTKITTPRQDVLFKKGYLAKRKTMENIGELTTVESDDGVTQQDCMNGEDLNQMNGNDIQLLCSAPQPYIDPSAIYYGGGYEIYDPYTGNVTALVVGASTGQPILTSMPCRPVPLQPVQWFNPLPSSDWCCSYSQQNEKRYSTDSQIDNGSGISSESSGAPESPNSLADEQMNNGISTFSSPYIYPGYMFGAPVYNVDGVNVQYCTPESPALSGNESTITKKKKKRKRRRRTGEIDEGSESSVDDTCNGSISGNECILDTESPKELDDDIHERDSTDTRDLPHANVNAAPFVPARSFMVNETEHFEYSPNPTIYFANRNENTSDLQTESNVCYAFEDKKLNTGTSSNNSDSGISSPGSEDQSNVEPEFTKFKSERTKNKNESSTASVISDATVQDTKSVDKDKCNGNGHETDDGKSKKNRIEEKLNKKNRTKKSTKDKNKSNKKDKFAEDTITKKADKKISSAFKNKCVINEKKSQNSLADVKVRSKIDNDDSINSQIFSKSNNSENETSENRKGQNLRDNCEISNQSNDCEEKAESIVSNILEKSIEKNSQLESPDTEQGENSDISIVIETNTESSIDKMEGLMHIEEKPLLAKLVDVQDLMTAYEEDISNFEESSFSEFASCRENTSEKISTSEEIPNREEIETTARSIVEEVVALAEARCSTIKCDKLQLPITQAVTNWLNERGGLPTVETECHSDDHAERIFEHDRYDENEKNLIETTGVDKKRPASGAKTPTGCVIC